MPKFSPFPLPQSTQIASRNVPLDRLPAELALREDINLVTASPVTGKVLYRADKVMYETRFTKTPGGDYLLMFPDGGHYGGSAVKTNDMIALRSKDGGETWSEPRVAFDLDYNQHGFIPLIPKGSKRLYCFGTQPQWGSYSREHGLQENAPIGYRYSDDDGYTFSETRIIRPTNDPGFLGMSVMRMCETDAGTWILGAHEGDWSYKPLMTRQYVLRSQDQGATWELLPGRRHGGWCVPSHNRMDEGRPINLGGGRVLMLIRTPEGRLWKTRSADDGQTWDTPSPTTLVHPDAPPMLTHLSDGKTLAAFHHNRFHDKDYSGLSAAKPEVMQDRSEMWVSLSTDEGETWSAPRFVFCMAALADQPHPFVNYQCSYMDVFPDNGYLHMVVPQRWRQATYLRMKESDLAALPLEAELFPK